MHDKKPNHPTGINGPQYLAWVSVCDTMRLVGYLPPLLSHYGIKGSRRRWAHITRARPLAHPVGGPRGTDLAGIYDHSLISGLCNGQCRAENAAPDAPAAAVQLPL
jgi:hypothetical protein